MNTNVSKNFRDISKAAADYIEECDTVFSVLLRQMQSNSSLYLPEAAKAKNDSLKQSARAALSSSYAKLESTATAALEALKGEAAAWSTAPAKAEFLDKLRPYRDFNLTMSETELNGLLKEANGNYLSLRCLKSVADTCSEYTFEMPELSSFDADISKIESDIASLRFYTGGNSGITDLLPNYVSRGVDYGRPTNAQIGFAMSASGSLSSDGLQAIGNRWSSTLKPDMAEIRAQVRNAYEAARSPENGKQAAVEAATYSQPTASKNLAEEAKDSAEAFARSRAEDYEKAIDGMKRFI